MLPHPLTKLEIQNYFENGKNSVESLVETLTEGWSGSYKSSWVFELRTHIFIILEMNLSLKKCKS